jgi:hypothetical protein
VLPKQLLPLLQREQYMPPFTDCRHERAKASADPLINNILGT